MLIVQSVRNPAAIRNAVVDIFEPDLTRVDVAVAYATKGGVNLFRELLRSRLGTAEYDALPKRLIVSLDFGITEPDALAAWKDMPSSEVLVAGSDCIARNSLQPRQAYHPKVYAFTRAIGLSNAVVGSANLTTRGWSLNTEASWSERDIEGSVIEAAITHVRNGCAILDNALLEAYRKLRGTRTIPKELLIETEPIQVKSVPTDELQSFKSALESGQLDPAASASLWVQGDALSGGAGSQLEMPRGADRFFGYHFTDYGVRHKVTIGTPVLRIGAKTWTDKILSWHGNNKMVRMNLPTHAQSGLSYDNSAVMFRRLDDDSFEVVVTPWESDLAKSWRQASLEAGLLFRLGGPASNRVVGLINKPE